MTRPSMAGFVAAGMAALVALSAWVIRGAFVQPFPTFRSGEAIVQVGVGFAVCVLWILAAVVIGGSVMTRRLRRRWLFGLVLAVLGALVVMPWPFRYVSEVEIRLSGK